MGNCILTKGETTKLTIKNLWTNPNSSSSFAEQDIEFTSADFNGKNLGLFVIRATDVNTSSAKDFMMGPYYSHTGFRGTMTMGWSGGLYVRSFAWLADYKFHFYANYDYTASGSTQQNAHLIPTRLFFIDCF